MKLNSRLILTVFIAALLIFSCKKEESRISPREKIFNDIVTQVENNHYGEVHSIIIAENDSIIFEKYFNNYTHETKHALYSVTKSFTSALIGICIDEGYIDNIDMKVLDFFPEYKNTIANLDSLKKKITIRDLLTMTAGFTWDEWTTSYNDPNT